MNILSIPPATQVNQTESRYLASLAFTEWCGYECATGFHEKGECWRPADLSYDWEIVDAEPIPLFELRWVPVR